MRLLTQLPDGATQRLGHGRYSHAEDIRNLAIAKTLSAQVKAFLLLLRQRSNGGVYSRDLLPALKKLFRSGTLGGLRFNDFAPLLQTDTHNVPASLKLIDSEIVRNTKHPPAQVNFSSPGVEMPVKPEKSLLGDLFRFSCTQAQTKQIAVGGHP